MPPPIGSHRAVDNPAVLHNGAVGTCKDCANLPLNTHRAYDEPVHMPQLHAGAWKDCPLCQGVRFEDRDGSERFTDYEGLRRKFMQHEYRPHEGGYRCLGCGWEGSSQAEHMADVISGNWDMKKEEE